MLWGSEERISVDLLKKSIFILECEFTPCLVNEIKLYENYFAKNTQTFARKVKTKK